MISLCLIALLFAPVIVFSEKLGWSRWEPLPECQDCLSPKSVVAPGVGFDLTPSYGTAAIRFHNGSAHVIGKFGGDDSYKSLMKRLSAESPRFPSVPEFDSIWDEIKYLVERARRQFNKRRGFPATTDVGIVGGLLKHLRLECEKKLGHAFTAAVPAIPVLPGMTKEDLDDAMEYAGLSTLRSYSYSNHVSETSAAFAGMGYGLCSSPRDLDTCEAEEATMPFRSLIAVGLTDSVLTLTCSVFRYAHKLEDFKTVFDYEHGLGALDSHVDASAYWDGVRTAISNVVAASSKPIDTLLLLGANGANKKLVETIGDALGNFQSPLSSTNLQLSAFPDPLYVAAMGAAEFAKRFQEMPWNCREPARCFESVGLVNQDNKGGF